MNFVGSESREKTAVLDSQSRTRRLGYTFLQSQAFEIPMGILIMFNFLMIIIETDKNAQEDDLPAWLDYASALLLLIFVVELVFKLHVFRWSFWFDAWNTFDFIVISVDVTMNIFELLGISLINVSMLRVARLARATKLLRVFPELQLMMAGLLGAVRAIFWGSVLLFGTLLVWSIIAVQFIHPLNKEVAEQGVYKDCDRCARAYESTLQACLTFFQAIVAGDSWGRETVPIIENYPLTAVFFVSVLISVGLAILNLILGVVCNVATEARDGLKREIQDQKTLMRFESQNQLLAMCHAMDSDGNQELTFEEVSIAYETNEQFRAILEEMDIERQDLQIVWGILDSDKSGTISAHEFVHQVYKMKNSDTQFMLAYIKFYITDIKHKLTVDFTQLHKKLDDDVRVIDSDIVTLGNSITGQDFSACSESKPNVASSFVSESKPLDVIPEKDILLTGIDQISKSIGGRLESNGVKCGTGLGRTESSIENIRKLNAALGELALILAPLPRGAHIDSIDILLEKGSLEALVHRVNLMACHLPLVTGQYGNGHSSKRHDLVACDQVPDDPSNVSLHSSADSSPELLQEFQLRACDGEESVLEEREFFRFRSSFASSMQQDTRLIQQSVNGTRQPCISSRSARTPTSI